MGGEDKLWLKLPKYSDKYINGVNAFLGNGFANYSVGNELRCPCKKCHNRQWHYRDVIYDHLICNGPSPRRAQWIYDVSCLDLEQNIDEMDCETGIGFGDNLDTMLHATHRNMVNCHETNEDGHKKGPNVDAQKFYRLVEEGKQPLYPGCKNFSRLSFIVKLYRLKCLHGITDSAFGDLLELIKEAFPYANVPKSFNDAKNIIKDLGLDYQKIHACPNDCMLYWAENEGEDVCRTCGASRWKVVEKKGVSVDKNCEDKIPKVPAKVMRYFPLKPRLQRMFMCKEFSQLMIWHAVERKNDGRLRHAADGKAWKTMDTKYPHFSSEIRNVRLGLASDGFNPFRTMSISHSTWPIILVNYNLPPWLNMKPENLILSTLISGPSSPGNNIDVYMQPLIAELKDLWDVGLETYDALSNQTFTLHASLLWTISDFPGYAMLSGWSTKGKLACPACNYYTSSFYLKHSRKTCYPGHRRFLEQGHKHRLDKRRFNGKIETEESPRMLTGTDIEELLRDYVNDFGKKKKQQKANSDSPLKKKPIFFELSYWSHNLCRHNFDVMHIEKNVCDNILGTLLDISGKTKDHYKARQDLEDLGIRKVLHPFLSNDGKHFEYRAASFDMTNEEKEQFCSVLKNAKLPYGCSSNISRCVQMNERKVSGYKSHDAHFILQYLLQFAVAKTLKPEVAVPLIRLGAFFRGICNKVIDLDEIKKLQHEITEILCELEMIFPPSFFDIMVHLPIHLCKEVELGGPVHNRWMFPIERFLGKLKSYVRNRSKPEGSIAEGYLAEECLTFCSRYLGDSVKTKIHKYSFDVGGSNSPNIGYPIGARRNKDGKTIRLDDDTWIKVHRYILFNCDNEEIETLIEEHRKLFDNQAKSKRYKREREHTQEFYKWLKEEVGKKESTSRELSSLARGPNRAAKRFSGYVINGYRFHTKQRDNKCTTQNSGVFVTALTTSFASSKDKNPIVGNVSYYGAIEEIIEVDYWGVFDVVLFRCCWYQEERSCYGLTRVNFNKLCQKNDPFVMAAQVQQVFFIEDPVAKGLHYIVKKMPRDWCDTFEGQNGNKDDINEPVLEPIHVDYGIECLVDEASWYRDDVPRRKTPIPSNVVQETDCVLRNDLDSAIANTNLDCMETET